MVSVRMFLDWINVRDYDKAKARATKQIISKQARGSVAAQNGSIISDEQLKAKSKASDASLNRLKKAVARA